MKRLSLLLLSTLTIALIVSSAYVTSSASFARTDSSPASDLRSRPETSPITVAAANASGNAGRGRQVYSERCAICHDKGGMGPTLKGDTHAMGYAASVAWIKNPKPPMPKLYPSRLSDTDVNDVATYVATLAGTPAAASTSTSAPHGKSKTAAGATLTTAQGKKLYGTSCAGCHGATGIEGGAGPSLKGEKSKKDRAAVIAWIKNPQPPMPKLYPSPLNEKEVSAIAAYIETL